MLKYHLDAYVANSTMDNNNIFGFGSATRGKCHAAVGHKCPRYKIDIHIYNTVQYMLNTTTSTLSIEPVRHRRARSAVCTHMMHLSGQG